MVKQKAIANYYFALTITGIIIIVTLIKGGIESVLPLLALAVIEITFSFENAVINSQVLSLLNKFWRTIFLTVGIAIAVFGVRLILPLVLVSSTTGLSVGHVLDLAMHDPDKYSHQLHQAYPIIASFGGVFLLMIGLRFFGEKKEVIWIDSLEARLAAFNQPWWITILGATVATSALYFIIAPGQANIVYAGLLGAMVFIIIKIIGTALVKSSLKNQAGSVKLVGMAAFMQFMYLELLDASFSFDGVIAAFAITKSVLLISAGLGIGALFVRSITIHLLNHQTLEHYRYLIHGAHYAILSLAILLLISIRVTLPEAITGFIGLIIIGLSIQNSISYNRRLET